MEKTSSSEWPCVSLIGMPGAGKSTIGASLAAELNWAFMDTDHVIESFYAASLQSITDALGKEKFLDVECEILCSLRASRCVIATGGSVVYRQRAISHLASLGPIVYVQLDFATIEQRVAANPRRGIAIAPGQTLADLFAERETLYKQAATLTCATDGLNPRECATWVMKNLKLA